ncbi:MAG: hypothetical protein HYY24_21430 [Verrucomicrobia bacterium]|nr:hypothetical protein [Verrucomicrobiota bacterium]
MRCFIATSIRKREFGGELPAEALDVLRRALRPALLLAIKGEGLPVKSRLLKAYATSRSGPRRIVLLLLVEHDDLFLLFYRPKGDKIGDNISINNPAFKSALARYLALLRSDIASHAIEEIPLHPPGAS